MRNKYEKRIPVLTDVVIISKPSLRVYPRLRKYLKWKSEEEEK